MGRKRQRLRSAWIVAAVLPVIACSWWAAQLLDEGSGTVPHRQQAAPGTRAPRDVGHDTSVPLGATPRGDGRVLADPFPTEPLGALPPTAARPAAVACLLVGRVIDGRGQPLGSAEVTFFEPSIGAVLMATRPAPVPGPSVETDADGRFQIELAPPWPRPEQSPGGFMSRPGGPARLRVTCPSFGPALVALPPEHARRLDVGDVPLPPEGRIVGELVDASGALLPSGNVVVTSFTLAAEPDTDHRLVASAVGSACRGGRFEVWGLPSSRAWLRLESDGCVPQRRDALDVEAGSTLDLGPIAFLPGA